MSYCSCSKEASCDTITLRETCLVTKDSRLTERPQQKRDHGIVIVHIVTNHYGTGTGCQYWGYLPNFFATGRLNVSKSAWHERRNFIFWSEEF